MDRGSFLSEIFGGSRDRRSWGLAVCSNQAALKTVCTRGLWSAKPYLNLPAAVATALAKIESGGKPITKAIAARSIDALEKCAIQLGTPNQRTAVNPLARLAKVSTLADMGRLVAARSGKGGYTPPSAAHAPRGS